jgi:hypothetical protein
MIRLKSLLTEDNSDIKWLYDKSHDNPFWIVDQNRDAIASQFGERITGVLAAGNNGFVYELASGKLMKITPDAKEVAAVMKLKRRPKMRHLISYYDVRNITNLVKNISFNDKKPEYVPVDNFYAIIMDRVTTLEPLEKDTWRDYYEYFLSEYEEYEANKETLDEFLEVIDASYQPIIVREFWQKIWPQRKNIIRDFKKSGINFYEAHQNNVGFDQFGQLVHFDPWIAGYGWDKPVINKARLNKPVQIPTKYTTDGIDTPGDPNM